MLKKVVRECSTGRQSEERGISSDHPRCEQPKTIRQCHAYRSTGSQSSDNAQITAFALRTS